ncbi:MAG: hypothetical protein U0163_05220 [Gemmatimonadaceae bacterium]
MGLAVCHGIVIQHGGAISVESTVGAGARFDVWLRASGAAVASTCSDTGTRGHRAHPDRRGRRVGAIRGATRARIARGYHVQVAADGQEAAALSDAELAEVDLVSPMSSCHG